MADGNISEADPQVEDYPCEGTMKHWRWWIAHNETNINGQIRTIMHWL